MKYLLPQPYKGFFRCSMSTVWKWQKFTLKLFFCENFVKATFALKKLLKQLISRNIFSVRVNFSFFNTVMVNQVIESICHSFSRRKCSAVLLRMLKSPPLFPHDLSRKFSLSKKTPNSHLENCYIMDNWTLIFQLHI